MDWNLAISMNHEALKRILAMLVTMVSVAGADPQGNRQATLPRHLHRFVLRLLRPAEAAARRLIIVAARGLVVKPSPPRVAKPQPKKPPLNRRNGYGTGIVIRPGPLPDWARTLAPKRSSTLSLPLFDPLKRCGGRRRYVKPTLMPRITSFNEPRISLFDLSREPNPPPPSPGDPLDAGRLHRRLDAIGRALDDLPGQAQRLARWQARRDAVLAQEREAGDGAQNGSNGARRAAAGAQTTDRFQRFSPMRPGRPPGWHRRPIHEVYEVLNAVHGLAVWAPERPDTS